MVIFIIVGYTKNFAINSFFFQNANMNELAYIARLVY